MSLASAWPQPRLIACSSTRRKARKGRRHPLAKTLGSPTCQGGTRDTPPLGGLARSFKAPSLRPQAMLPRQWPSSRRLPLRQPLGRFLERETPALGLACGSDLCLDYQFLPGAPSWFPRTREMASEAFLAHQVPPTLWPRPTGPGPLCRSTNWGTPCPDDRRYQGEYTVSEHSKYRGAPPPPGEEGRGCSPFPMASAI